MRYTGKLDQSEPRAVVFSRCFMCHDPAPYYGNSLPNNRRSVKRQVGFFSIFLALLCTFTVAVIGGNSTRAVTFFHLQNL